MLSLTDACTRLCTQRLWSIYCMKRTSVFVCACRRGSGGGWWEQGWELHQRINCAASQVFANTHATLTPLQTGHMCPLSQPGGQAKPHVTTLAANGKDLQGLVTPGNRAWLNMHGHQLRVEWNQTCSHMPLTVGGRGRDLIYIWKHCTRGLLTARHKNTPHCQSRLHLMQSWRDYISHRKSMHALEVVQQRGWINEKFIASLQRFFSFFSVSRLFLQQLTPR